MPANATKAQVSKRYKDAGIMEPKGKLDDEALQARLKQRSVKFANAKAKEARSRAAARKKAIDHAS